MKIRVVLKKSTCNLLWAQSDVHSNWKAVEGTFDPTEDEVVELDEQVVSRMIDLFNEPTLDAAIGRLAHAG